MRKSLVLALTALSGGASYAASPTDFGRDPAATDPATWRWHVSSILDDQGPKAAAAPVQSASALNFQQRYARYSAVGQPERRP
jgi:hypothetical protein